MQTLKRSNDRKVTVLANAAGTQSRVANAFGLPAGREFSCPGATPICESVCYAGKLEKIYKGVRGVLTHNFDLLTSTNQRGMESLLRAMISEFVTECERKNARKAFRIHWDGDFYSREYAAAWVNTVKRFPHVEFWAYTRSFTPGNNVIDILADIPNLALYLSVDAVNAEFANVIIDEYPSVKIAALSDTMEQAGEVIKGIRNDSKPGAKCPELIGAIPLIDANGGACISCNLCPLAKADIRFAFTNAGRQ